MKLPIKLLTLLASTTLMATLAAAQAPAATVDAQAHGNLERPSNIIEAFNFDSAQQRERWLSLVAMRAEAKELLRDAIDEISSASADAEATRKSS